MVTASQFGIVPVEQYLKTVYETDCELVNGFIEERNVGEYEHRRLQYALIIYLDSTSRNGTSALQPSAVCKSLQQTSASQT